MPNFAKLNPHFKPYAKALYHVARKNGLHPVFTSGFRSIRRQTELYDRFLRGEHPFPVAPPGHSLHNYGLAMDLVSDNNEWLGKVWEHWGGRYGGTSDWIHFSPRR